MNRELVDAVRQDDIARIRAIASSGADVNGSAPKTGYTPLMWAKSAEATRTLIHAGASVHTRDHQGHTPLMWVISKSNVPDQAARIAKELIGAGADLNVQDKEGKTALDWARHHRDRLREPRLQRIAEELVTILESTTGDPLRRLEAAGFTREQAKAIGDFVGDQLTRTNLADTETCDDINQNSSRTTVLEPGPRKRGAALQEQVSRLMHVLLDRRWRLVDEAELERWRDADYCQRTLELKIGHKGLLRKVDEGPLDSKGRGRYWKDPYHGWLVCSQWWKMDHAWNAMALTKLCKRIIGSTRDRVPTEVYRKLRAIERDLADLARLAGR